MPDDPSPRRPPQDRRSFLAMLGGAALGGVALAAGGLDAVARAAAAAEAAAPPGGARLGPLGLQLYTVRRAMERDVERTLARVAAIGYREVEFAGYFGRSPTAVRTRLDALHLSAPSAHVALATLQADTAQAIAAATVIGHQWLVVPWIDDAARRTLDDWRVIARSLNALGAQLSRAGIRLAYHNHDFEFVPIDGRLPYDLLLTETDPALVSMEMDLYWTVKSGQDPVAYFAQHPGRFPMVHVKDSRGAPAHVMTEVGRGTIDWHRILSRRSEAGIVHYFVEHDEPADPFASIKASYRYLRKLDV